MGWKGTIRSLEAAANRADRNAERKRKQNQKLQALANDAASVKAFEEYLNQITGLHRHVSSQNTYNWRTKDPRVPEKPTNLKKNEKRAQQEHDGFIPSLFHRLFGLTERKKNKLQGKVAEAREHDEKIFDELKSKYEEDYSNWEIRNLIENGNPDDLNKAYFKILKEKNTFTKIGDIGSSISIFLEDNGNFFATVNVHGDDVIPNEKYTLRQSGTLSTKNMPKGEFNELYQDYVCSCVLRIALEIFALVPIEKVLINANDNLLNPKTGHLEEQTLLSVLVVKRTIEQLNIENIDPSDAMENFLCNMKYTKARGFSPVDPLSEIQDVNT
ncbi:MAG: hypothetical protein V7723_10740 [Sneathiella sp.]|uniref:hypothetical protein n=1 Tax=Sneathiella sp. TaxID=1964365 RepID=UPI0030020E30